MKKVFNLLNLSVPGETYEVATGIYVLERSDGRGESGKLLAAISPKGERIPNRLIVGHDLTVSDFGGNYWHTTAVTHVKKATKNKKSFVFQTKSGSKYTLKVK